MFELLSVRRRSKGETPGRCATAEIRFCRHHRGRHASSSYLCLLNESFLPQRMKILNAKSNQSILVHLFISLQSVLLLSVDNASLASSKIERSLFLIVTHQAIQNIGYPLHYRSSVRCSKLVGCFDRITPVSWSYDCQLKGPVCHHVTIT